MMAQHPTRHEEKPAARVLSKCQLCLGLAVWLGAVVLLVCLHRTLYTWLQELNRDGNPPQVVELCWFLSLWTWSMVAYLLPAAILEAWSAAWAGRQNPWLYGVLVTMVAHHVIVRYSILTWTGAPVYDSVAGFLAATGAHFLPLAVFFLAATHLHVRADAPRLPRFLRITRYLLLLWLLHLMWLSFVTPVLVAIRINWISP